MDGILAERKAAINAATSLENDPHDFLSNLCELGPLQEMITFRPGW